MTEVTLSGKLKVLEYVKDTISPVSKFWPSFTKQSRMEQDKRSPNRPRLAGIRQINFGVNHTFEELNRNFNHLGSFKMLDLV